VIKGHGERTGLPSRDEVIAPAKSHAPSALKTPIGQRFAAF
jgi:hypothetical protein